MTASIDKPMAISGLNHYTIRCAPADLPALMDFYSGVLGLQAGERPTMPRPGFWLYSAGQPIVHLYAAVDEHDWGSTRGLDHISFRTHGLAATRARLATRGVSCDEAPLPGTTIHQLFVRDPTGLKLELTFDLKEEQEA